jgi:hypothetical protein
MCRVKGLELPRMRTREKEVSRRAMLKLQREVECCDIVVF